MERPIPGASRYGRKRCEMTARRLILIVMSFAVIMVLAPWVNGPWWFTLAMSGSIGYSMRAILDHYRI